MRCNWIQKFAGATACSGLMLLSGCYNMNGYVMNASGQGYYEQGNYAMAAQEFQQALSSNPQSADYMANLAKARMKMGDPGTAEQLFRQALTTDPAHQPSYHGLSELLLAQGRGEDAGRLLNTWAATQPYVAESHVELAWLQRELGQHDAAAQSLQQALQVNPNHSTALSHLGQYYQDTGQPAQAVAMYQQSLRSDWNQPEVHSRLATAAEAAGPGHPMSEMAMARGVHPQDIPRQQLAFGSRPGMMPAGFPAPGQQQLAFQPQMGQPQMAYQQPGSYPPPPAFQQGMPQQQVAFQQQMPGMTGPGQPQTTSTFMPPSHGMMGMPMMPFMGGSIENTTSPTMTPNSSTPVSSGLPPAPTPDPAFSSSNPQSVPVTSVSHSIEVDSGVPEIEAF